MNASGGGSSKEVFQRCFGGGLNCRLALIQYANLDKNPLQAHVLASAPFSPTFTPFDQPTKFTVAQFLGSNVPGANFSIGNGLGVAIFVETAAPHQLAAGESAYLRLHAIHLDFNPRKRNDDVTV